jgi:hypothetical protein
MVKKQREAHLSSHMREVEIENKRISDQIEALQSIIKTGLARDPRIDFNRLARSADKGTFDDVCELPREPSFKEFEPKSIRSLSIKRTWHMLPVRWHISKHVQGRGPSFRKRPLNSTRT